MLSAIITLLIFAMLTYWLSARLRKSGGLPIGKVIYSDPKTWGAVEKPFFAPTYNLTGKPDHIFKQGNVLIPVEVKSRLITDTPYESHIMQLAAYCLLVENHFGIRPPFGVLHYPNRTFSIQYTPTLESRLKALLKRMENHSAGEELHRSHKSFRRCQRCGFRPICDEALGKSSESR